jgi:4-alpha-glucanotransferase
MLPQAAQAGRIAGVTIPLFSIRTRRSWGIGAITDLPMMAELARLAGLSLIQLLPIAEGSGGSTSPYSALSAFGVDWIYLDCEQLPGLSAEDALAALGAAGRAALAAARSRPTIDYPLVRELKRRALRAAFDAFWARESREQGPHGQAFIRFMSASADWLDNLALFCALKEAHGGVAWWQWPQALRDRHSDALAAAARQLDREVLYHKYLQWAAELQWMDARRRVRAHGVELMGDLPFMVDRDSADVWANRAQFHMDMSVGVPADQFDEDGQDWGLPPYHWEQMARDGFRWLRRRCAYAGHLYDRFRIDHLVGFYRTYMRPYDRRRDARGKLVPGVFNPAAAAQQLAHGENVLKAMLLGAASTGARLIAEDLGVIPDYVRPSLLRLHVPGYKVLIWEKDKSGAFLDPRAYPALSVACFGTHDTDSVVTWWSALPPAERQQAALLLGVEPHKAFTAPLHRALTQTILSARSELVLLLIQDILGARERINKPGTLGDHNWSYRLPAPIEDLVREPAVRGKLAMLRECVTAARRLPAR